MIDEIYNGFNDDDWKFLISVSRCKPNWDIYDFHEYPSIQWKLLNLEKFKVSRGDEFEIHIRSLESLFNDGVRRP